MSTIDSATAPTSAAASERPWTLAPYSGDALTALVRFHESTLLPGGRKFPTTAAGVADGLDGHVAGSAVVLRVGDEVRGYAALFAPQIPGAPGWTATVVSAPDAPDAGAAALWQSVVDRFHEHRPQDRRAFLRVFESQSHAPAERIAYSLGFAVERTFSSRRRPLTAADADRPLAEGFTALTWDDVVARGLTEQVRHVQYVAFLEHFGELSKSPAAWQHHLTGAVFAPELSVAVLADDQPVDTVVGVLLASRYTDDSSGTREENAHADYIGVLGSWRRRGIAELAIRTHLALAWAQGQRAVSLGVDTINHGANRVYARLGYEINGQSAAFRLDV